MGAYGILLLCILAVAALVLVITLKRPWKDKGIADKVAERKDVYKPPEFAAVRPDPDKSVVIKKKPEVKPPEKAPEPVIVKPHTTVYEYTPTRGVVRCRVCDGENPNGSAMCSICGNYLTN